MTREQVEEAIQIMEGYLKLRLRLRDWHGVMDAAADLRELEVKLQMLKEGANDSASR